MSKCTMAKLFSVPSKAHSWTCGGNALSSYKQGYTVKPRNGCQGHCYKENTCLHFGYLRAVFVYLNEQLLPFGQTSKSLVLSPTNS